MLGRADEVTQHTNAACLPAAHARTCKFPAGTGTGTGGERRVDDRNTRKYAIETELYSTLPDPRNIPHVTCIHAHQARLRRGSRLSSSRS